MKLREKIIIAALAILFVGVFLIQNQLKLKSRVVFCDVGQGDGAFINLPGGMQIVVDGGPDNSLMGCVGKHMPYFDRRIEYIIVSHPDSDHYVGLVEVLKRYDVGKVILNGGESAAPAWQELKKLSAGKIYIASAGDDFKIGGAELEFLSPEKGGQYKDDNERSLVFKFIYSSRKILFTGDLPAEIESMLVANGADLQSDILKLGHHGSGGSSSLKFLRAVAPKLAVISVGAENPFGHPAHIIIKRLENLGVKYLRTDESGDIVVNLD